MRRALFVVLALFALSAFVAVPVVLGESEDTNQGNLYPETDGSGKVIGNGGPGCPDYYACAWEGRDYSGYKWKKQGGQAGYWFLVSPGCDPNNGCPHGDSAKNRMTNRRLKLMNGPRVSDWYVQACLDPGENRPSPGNFRWIKIGVAGSRCNN